MFCNYKEWYWELYSKIEDCLEEIIKVSYELELTPGKKLCEDLTLNPRDELHDLMTRVEMFSQLEDDVR